MAEQEKQDDGTLFFVESKTSMATPRLIRAKSAAAVRAFLAAEMWGDPRPAKIADMERAVSAGAKPERI